MEPIFFVHSVRQETKAAAICQTCPHTRRCPWTVKTQRMWWMCTMNVVIRSTVAQERR